MRFSKESAPSKHLLIAVAKKSGGNVEAAQVWLRRKVQLWQSELDRNNLIVLEGLGTFRNNGQFLPDQVQYDPASFGMASVMLHPIHVPSALDARMSVRFKSTTPVAKTLQLWQKAAAAAAVAALVTVSFWQTELPTQAAGWIQWPSFKGAEVTAPASESEALAPQSEEEAVLAEDAGNETAEEVAPTDLETPQQTALTGAYTLVVGAFSQPENAQVFAERVRAQGWEANVVEKHLYIVQLGNFDSREMAAEQLSNVKKSINEQAWICAL